MSEKGPSLIELSRTEWKDILFWLKKGEAVLVIGPGAITDENGTTLYEKLCGELDTEMNKDTRGQRYRLFFLAESLKQQKAGESLLLEAAEKVYKTSYINETASKLARIPFPLIISTSGDTMLRNAFEEQAIPLNYDFYNYHSTPGKLDKPTADNPLLYKLFGSIEEEDSLIFTHDNLYEFLFSILGSKPLPLEIRDKLRTAKNFIFLGFDFEEWYLQIILRLFEIHNEKNSYAYAWQELNENTISFYSTEFQLDFINGKIPGFVDQLYEKCHEEGILKEKQEAPAISDKLKNLLKQNEITAAIDQMDSYLTEQEEDDLLNQVFMLSGRYNQLLTKARKGTISDDNYGVEERKIVESLNAIIEEIAAL